MSGMFGWFEEQFTKTDEGYLFYPSPWKGGKLVSSEEHQAFIAAWHRATSVGAVTTASALGLLCGTVPLVFMIGVGPGWIQLLPVVIWAVGFYVWFRRPVAAATRAVADRPYASPPRPDAWRQNRAQQSWPFLAFFWILSAKNLWDGLQGDTGAFPQSVTVVFYGAALLLFTIVAVLKLRDRLASRQT